MYLLIHICIFDGLFFFINIFLHRNKLDLFYLIFVEIDSEHHYINVLFNFL